MEFECRGTKEGLLEFGVHGRARFKQFLAEHGPVRLKITPELPESGRLRRYFEGAIVPLIAYYQEGMDHRSSEDRRKVREWLKAEFNGELVEIGGKVQRIAMSTKGRPALNEFVERVTDWVKDNYDPPAEALDSEKFKHWRDTVFPFGGPETYIDYLTSLNILKPL